MMRKRDFMTALVLPFALAPLGACDSGEATTMVGVEEAEALFAQEVGHSVEGHMARLQAELELSDGQVAELRTIFSENRAELQAMHEGSAADHEARHEAFRKAWPEIHKRVMDVLTEEQRTRLEELMRAHAEHLRTHAQPRGDAHGGSHGSRGDEQQGS